MAKWLRRRSICEERGQTLMEAALILPLVIVIVLGVIEVGYALLDEHIVTKLSREGSNMISRDTSLQDARIALISMSSGAVNFGNGNSTVILSVIKRGALVGSSNYNTNFMLQRHQYGSFAATSVLSTSGSASFGSAPDYIATNADNNPNLRVNGLPPNLLVDIGAYIYVTEVYSRHPLLTPLDRFGVTVPPVVKSIAYF